MPRDHSSATPDRASLDRQLNQSRKELLDLTGRNSLLNFRPSRIRGLKITDAIPHEVFRILVRDRRAMSFRPAEAATEAAPAPDDQKTPAALPPLMATDDDPGRPAGRRADNRLQTPYDRTQLDLRLRNTFRFAHTSLEEQGVNILYLALGMLHWYESESSEDPRWAPLILVPAALSRTDARTRFKIEFADEEIDANLSLEEKLRQEFDIRLPPLSDAEDIDVGASPRVVVAVRPHRWSVMRRDSPASFYLTNCSSTRTARRPGRGQASVNHPIHQPVRYGGFREPDSTIAEDDHLDEHLDVSDTHQVVDSDSSQTLAVIDVKNGRNFVIQGPPGTGKSQTITNLIAEAIASDKRVLFVAEKMAALDVVKRRLDEIHIGDACLELHSQKANKRAVLDELKRTLGLGKPRLSDPTEDRALLAANRARLNDYCRAVNTQIGQSGASMHDIVGRLSQLARSGPAEWPPITIDEAASWTRAEFMRRLDQVDALRALVNTIGARSKMSSGSAAASLLPMDRSAVARALEEAADTAGALRRTLDGLQTLLRLKAMPNSTEELTTLVRSVLRAADAPDLVGVDHRHPAWLDRAESLVGAANAISTLTDLHDDYDRLLTPTAWEAAVEPYRHPIRTWGRRWLRFCSGAYRRACNGLRDLCRDTLPADGAKQLAIVEAILEAQRLDETVDASRDLLSHLLPDRMVDRDATRRRRLAETVSWLNKLHADRASGKLEATVHEILDHALDRTTLQDHAERCRIAMEAFSSALDAVLARLEAIPARFPDVHALSNRRFTAVTAWLQRARGELDSLNDIVRFNQQEARLSDDGLEAVIETAISWPEAGVHLTAHFEHTWLTALLTTAFHDNPQLAEFDGASHQHIIERFRQLDLDLFQHNRALVAEAHWQRLPRDQGGGQLGVVRREFEKKRRHLPIRKLMTEAGNAILQIKPVFMMSPLSIAKFIPPGSVRFDLVIFDEASQVRPVDALGALLRAGQAVVVGDTQQLPPTSFFDRMAEDGDDPDTRRPPTSRAFSACSVPAALPNGCCAGTIAAATSRSSRSRTTSSTTTGSCSSRAPMRSAKRPACTSTTTQAPATSRGAGRRSTPARPLSSPTRSWNTRVDGRN